MSNCTRPSERKRRVVDIVAIRAKGCGTVVALSQVAPPLLAWRARLGVYNCLLRHDRPKTKSTLGRQSNPTKPGIHSSTWNGFANPNLPVRPRLHPQRLWCLSLVLQTRDEACLAYAVRSRMELPSQYLLRGFKNTLADYSNATFLRLLKYPFAGGIANADGDAYE